MSDDRPAGDNPFDPKLTQPRTEGLPPSNDPTVVAAPGGDEPTTVQPDASTPPTTVQPATNDGWTTFDPATPGAAATAGGAAPPPPPPPALSPAEQSPFGLANQPPPPWPTTPLEGGVPVTASLSNRALAVLILAITSYVLCPVIPAIAALVIAGGADREIDESQGRLTGRGLVTAGRILAWVQLALVVLFTAAIFGLLLWGLLAGMETPIQPDSPRVDV